MHIFCDVFCGRLSRQELTGGGGHITPGADYQGATRTMAADESPFLLPTVTWAGVVQTVLLSVTLHTA